MAIGGGDLGLTGDFGYSLISVSLLFDPILDGENEKLLLLSGPFGN